MQLEENNVPTGSAPLDRVIGGLPRRQVTLLYGEPGTGKTTLAVQASGNAAKQGMKVLFVDADNSFYPERLADIAGASPEVSRRIFVSKPRSFFGLTHLLENLGSYINSGTSLVVVDTVTSLYREALAGGQSVFSLNRELNLQLAYLVETARVSGPAVLITSQVRSIPLAYGSMPRIEPVATRVVKFWPQRIMRISTLPETGLREVFVEKAEEPQLVGARVTLRLGEEGLG